jgi:uncharacterized membrane protein YcaP (DUF421 family)
MMIQDDDVMNVAREQGIRELSGMRIAVLESFGQINVLPQRSDGNGPDSNGPDRNGEDS